MSTRTLVVGGIALVAQCAFAGQGPAPKAQPAARQPVAVPALPSPPSQEGYSYKAEGRRDPFVSLVNRASDPRQSRKKPDGLRGFVFDEITLRGVIQSRSSGPLALVLGPDSKTYLLHVGDQLYDAVVKAITSDSLVVLQDVNDPLSLAKQRERRKTLRVVEEVK